MNFLPAFYFPTTLICVDDTQLALDGYDQVFSDSFSCVFFKEAKSVQNFFSKYRSKLSTMNFLNKISEFEHDKFSTETAVKLDISQIINLANSKDKYKEVSVVLSDYYMPPGIDGLELCKSLSTQQAKKMLLTENQTYDTARDALNSGVIDYFANKTDPITSIKQAVSNLATKYFCDLTADFAHFIQEDSAASLKDPIFIEYFLKLVADNNIVEYYLIDKNGSYLLVTADNEKYVLIVHNDRSLTEFAELLSEYIDLKNKTKLIKNKQFVPFFGVGKELSNISIATIDNCLFMAEKITGKQSYYVHLLKSGDLL